MECDNQQRRRILVVGLGNLLLRDDGVGVHAVQKLQKDPPRGVCLAEVGTAVLRAVHLFEWADRILAIDAVQAYSAPGAIYRFSAPQVGAIGELPAHSGPVCGQPVSLHELNLLGALRFLRRDHPRPEVVILGVEPEIIDYGLDLSEPVRAALPQLVQTAKEIVDGWMGSAESVDRVQRAFKPCELLLRDSGLR